MSEPVQIVSVLIGEEQMELGLECLGSLVNCSRDPLAFQIHDDGTLTGRSRDRLSDLLPLHRIIARAEADDWAAEALRPFPACHRFRSAHPYGLKLFDVPHFHPADTVAYCDSDIFFLRPFQGLFDHGQPASDILFMQDCQEAYAIRPWDLIGPGALRLVRRLNSGLFYFRRSTWPPALFEEIIRRDSPRFGRLPGWLEQTCWSALARTGTTRFWHHGDILVPKTAAEITAGPVAVHLTSSVRGLLAVARANQNLSATPAVVRTEPARSLTLAGFCWSEAKRVMRNRLP